MSGLRDPENKKTCAPMFHGAESLRKEGSADVLRARAGHDLGWLRGLDAVIWRESEDREIFTELGSLGLGLQGKDFPRWKCQMSYVLS